MKIPVVLATLSAAFVFGPYQARAQSSTQPSAPVKFTQTKLGTWIKLTPTRHDEKPLSGTTNWVIAADKIDYPSAELIIGQGHVAITIDGQHASLHCAKVSYDKQSSILNAEGNVEILRNGLLTKGSSFAFRADSAEYLVTEPNVSLHQPQACQN